MNIKTLLLTAAIPASLILPSMSALAQTSITDTRTTPVTTSTVGDNNTADDVTIATGGTVTPDSGTAVTVDSDNSVTNEGSIAIEDADNAVGVDLQGGNTGGFTNSGSVNILESFTPTDTDGDGIVDGRFAEGTGRTGILVSGASPFSGDIDLTARGTILVEGNESFAVRILRDAGLTGNLFNNGTINALGDNSFGISVEGDITGNINSTGAISVRGENTVGVNISGDVNGQFVNSGSITSTGYRFTDRPVLSGRNLLDAEDLYQAGSAIQVSGNITNGIFLQEREVTQTNSDGSTTTSVVGVSNVSQLGSAPAILLDGQGVPIAIGIVASITDPNDADFEADEQYAFVNQGRVTASGVYDDVNATVLEIRDATLTNGINNTSTLNASAFRSGDDGTADVAGATGLARVIVLGDNAIADTINNSGLIVAQVNEATDEVYADRSNVVDPRFIQAIAVDIGTNATSGTLVNSGSVSALITGRNGEAIAIRDASGTLTMLENSGSISALGVTSDAQNLQATSFNLIALDFSANTNGVTINQVAAVDTDTTDSITPVDPSINGDILLGSGADTLNVSKGSITGDLAFGAGADVFSLTGGSAYTGALSDTDGALTLAVAGSTLTNTGNSQLNVTEATFDDTSVFRPTLDGATGAASGLVASGDITFADGATISPVLNNVISSTASTFTVLDAGGNLNLLGTLDSLSGIESPFMYDTSFAIDPNNPNALIVTLDLRSTDQLGLDSVQAASFSSAFEAMQNNTDLANAFINITDGNEFNGALNQLLPEFAAAARQFVVANVDGATGAVGTHLDNARRSQDRPGGVWLQEFAYFADRDLAGLAEQYRGHGFGLTGGLDTALGPFHTVGVNLGFASTEIEDVVGVDEPLSVVTLQLGSYAGYQTGNLGIEAYAGAGFNDFESIRNVEVGNFTGTSSGDWQGMHYNASLRAGYDLQITDRFWARPVVSVDYLSLNEEAYTETGPTGLALDVEERTSELGGVTALLNFGAKFEGRRTWLRPAIRVGYRNEFINKGLVTNYGFVGLNNRATLQAADFPDNGILVGFSILAGSKYSSFGLDFDSDIRDGFIRHTGRLVLRLIF